MDCSLLGSSVHGVLQARILEWIAMLSFMGSSWHRDWTCVSCTSCIGRQVLYHCTTWEAQKYVTNNQQGQREETLPFAFDIWLYCCSVPQSCLTLRNERHDSRFFLKSNKQYRVLKIDLRSLPERKVQRKRNQETPWTVAHQAFLSFIVSWSLLRLMFIESMVPSNHLILLLPPSLPAVNPSQHQGLFQWVGS